MKILRRTTLSVLSIASCLLLSSLGEAKDKKPVANNGIEQDLKFKAGDEKGNEVKALKTELLVMNTEKRALAQLQKLEKKYKGTRMEPEILFRLAELYMRRARTERFFEIHKDSEQIASFVPQIVKAASEAGEIRKAVGIYERIQRQFPDFRSMDVVLFNCSYAYQQLGEDQRAETLLLKIIRSYSDSILVPDAYLAIGEINFKRRQFAKALDNFKAIRNFPRARVYPYGLYKAAWSYYNLQNAPEGMRELEDVVKFGRAAAEAKLDAKLDLRKEALGDLALFYADVHPSGKAVNYFRDQAKELDPLPYILRLVELYKRHSRLNDVEIVLKDVLGKMPNVEGLASIHEELIWNYERGKQREKAIVQLQALDSYCDQQMAEKNKLLKQDKAPRHECQVKMADVSKKIAIKWHALWKKQGGGDDLSAGAESAYRLYVKSADRKDPELPAVRYSYAELSFALGKFREASGHYAAIEEYHKTDSSISPKIALDAAYAAVVSLEKAVDNKWNDADEKRFIQLSESYITRFPTGTYVLDLKFKRAFIAYEKERYDEAGEQFKMIGWMSLPAGAATPEKILKAQDLYLDILNVKKDYKTLREAAQSLMGARAGETQRQTQITKIYREAYFAEIQGLEERGKPAQAVSEYKKFATENKDSELAPKAWWNASQLQFKTGDAMGGANTCAQMYQMFPKSPNNRDCLTQAAQTYEAIARLDLASKVVLVLAEMEAGKEHHWKEVAADFMALSGSESQALTMYLKLADSKKGDAQVRLLDKAMQVARYNKDAKTVKAIEAKYVQMQLEPEISRMVVEEAEAALERGDLTKAFNFSKKIIGKDGLPKGLLARARFVQARVLEDEYRQQSVKSKVERIGIVLAIKTEKLEKAQKAYQSAIRYNDPDTSIRSLRRLSDCYIDYAKTVRGMSLPGEVSEADQNVFKAEIEQLSIPMEEKGIEAMGQAIEVAKKAQLRDGQVAELQSELDKLNMSSKPAVTITVAEPAIYLPQFKDDFGKAGL